MIMIKKLLKILPMNFVSKDTLLICRHYESEYNNSREYFVIYAYHFRFNREKSLLDKFLVAKFFTSLYFTHFLITIRKKNISVVH